MSKYGKSGKNAHTFGVEAERFNKREMARH